MLPSGLNVKLNQCPFPVSEQRRLNVFFWVLTDVELLVSDAERESRVNFPKRRFPAPISGCYDMPDGPCLML